MKIWCTWSGLWDECRTLSICILWWLQWCVHLCVASLCHGGKTLLTFFLWDKLDKGLHSNFVVSSQSSLCKKVTRIITFSFKKTVATIFSVDCTFFNFSFLRDVMWYHWLNCHSHFCSKWCAQISSPMTATVSLHLWYIIGVKSIVTVALSPYVHLSAFLECNKCRP